MHPAELPAPRRWLYALKPASWPKLLVPAALGQVCGTIAAGQVSTFGLAVGLGFTACALVSIVLLNDVGDIAVDTLKRRLFPTACSPKTIPDGILFAESVALAGVGAGLCAAAIALCGALWLERPALLPLGLCCLLFLPLYTFPPARLNYRGGGEALEMLGVGVALPCFTALAAGGVGDPLPLILPGFSLLALASAIASGLADEHSDRLGGKSTFVTAFGNREARAAISQLVLAACGLWAVAAHLAPTRLAPLAVAPAVAVVLVCGRRLDAVSESARSDRFAALRIYKRWLHRAIWWGTSALCVGLALVAAIAGWP